MIKIDRFSFQFRLIVVLCIWIAVLSYSLVSTFINDYWIQQWASNNVLPLIGVIFTMTFSSLVIISGFRSGRTKQKKTIEKKLNKRERIKVKEL